jgi:hypothetical protein
VRIGGPGISVGQRSGVDVSSTPDDSLMVSLSPGDSPDMAPIVWRRSAHRGFQGNRPALVEAFRDAVDQAAKNNKP